MFLPTSTATASAAARSTRPAWPVLLLSGLLLASGAWAQEGTGGDVPDPEAPEPETPLVVKTKGDGATRKEKRQRKKLEKEREKAREERKRLERLEKKRAKDQKKWRKMGLAARTAPEWYAEALHRYKAGKYLQAREILLPLEDSPRAVDIQEKVKLLIADTYYYQGGTLNLAEALARYRSFLTFYPNSEHAEYALFQIGNSYYKQLGPADRDQSFTDNAIAEYEKLIERYPDGEYRDQAEKRMLEARALRARHEFQVAKFYHGWENYDAAAARLERLLHERPELPDREEALYLAAQSFYALGELEKGDAYAARLRADHPGSKYAGKVERGRDSGKAERIAKRERKLEKEKRRTYERQRKREMRRTRQIRKDSGLTAIVPGTTEEAVLALQESEERESVRSEKEARKEAAAAEKHRKRMEKLEQEEQERRAREIERQLEREQRAEQVEPEREMTEKERRKAEKRRAKAEKKAEKHRKRMEKLEREEQEKERKKAERERERAEKKARKEEKKREKREKKDEEE